MKIWPKITKDITNVLTLKTSFLGHISILLISLSYVYSQGTEKFRRVPLQGKWSPLGMPYLEYP